MSSGRLGLFLFIPLQNRDSDELSQAVRRVTVDLGGDLGDLQQASDALAAAVLTLA